MIRFLGISFALLLSAQAEPLISEFQALNSSTLKDGDGRFSDWIELHNPDATATAMKGWSLVDTSGEKWLLPDVTIAPGGYLLVFASGQTKPDYRDAAGYWHATFKLGQEGRLALLRPDGSTAMDFGAGYPQQRSGFSYGLVGAKDLRHFPKPTPGAANDAASAVLGFVGDTRFSVDRGFFTTPISVAISCDTPGATIRYTLDSSTPSATKGEIYAGPIAITTTAVLRAMAHKEGWLPSNVDTHTYLYPHDVAAQAQEANPAGYPARWVSVNADYAMDNNPGDYAKAAGNANFTPEEARAAVAKSLQALPSFCITTDIDNWFHATTGIYTHPDRRGAAWEKACSAELIHPDGKKGFHINAGVRIQGLTSRSLGATPKLSLRVVFRGKYGEPNLDYQVYPDIPLTNFNTIRLRSNYRDTWLLGNQALYVADQWVKDAARDMQQPYLAGDFWHVYINGLYWGVYNPTERPDGRYAEAHFGGDVDDYDSVTLCCGNNLVEGDTTEWNDFLRLCRNNGVTGNEGYLKVQGLNPDLTRNPSYPRYLDVDHFIDYMILGQYHATGDWPGNFYVLHRDTPEKDQPFMFIQWDNDLAFTSASPSANKVLIDAGSAWWKTSPGELEIGLRRNAEFRLRYADRVYRHLFHDGALTQAPSQARFDRLAAKIEPGLYAESARWGDRVGRLATVQDNWKPMVNLMKTRYFPQRANVLLSQFRRYSLYPAIDAPEFNQHGGSVPSGFVVKFTAPKGRIYYTLDGSDPRQFGGFVSSSAKTAISGSAGPEAFLNGDLTTVVAAFVPKDDSLGDRWKQVDFDEAGWTQGKLAVGYDLLGGYTSQVGVDLSQDMYRQNATCYARVAFNLGDPASLTALTLKMKYDDGFLAYINGVEVARANAPAAPRWDSTATADRPDAEAAQFASFDILAKRDALRVGRNVLAIQGLNIQPLDDDFLLAAGLEGQSGAGSEGITLTKTTTVKTRALDGDVWSALHEATFHVGQLPTAANLKLTEIHYDPAFTAAEAAAGFQGSDFEFLELTNFSREAVSLVGLRFTDGIDFVFPSADATVPAGGSVLVVANRQAFLRRYGQGLADKIVGEYGSASALANNGERLALVDAAGKLLADVSYDNKAPWAEADEIGASLTLGVPADGPGQDARRWRTSLRAGGTPGEHLALAEEWRRARFSANELADASISGDNANPDGDPFSNLMERALGLNPKTPDALYPHLLRAERTREAVKLSWLEPVDAALRLQVQASSDLRQWRVLDTADASDDGPLGEAWRKRELRVEPGGVAYLRLIVGQ